MRGDERSREEPRCRYAARAEGAERSRGCTLVVQTRLRAGGLEICADVGHAPPVPGGRGKRDPDVPNRCAPEIDPGELTAARSGGGGRPVRAVGTRGDGVAARVVADRCPGVEDDVPGWYGCAEVHLQVLPGSLGGA